MNKIKKKKMSKNLERKKLEEKIEKQQELFDELIEQDDFSGAQKALNKLNTLKEMLSSMSQTQASFSGFGSKSRRASTDFKELQSLENKLSNGLNKYKLRNAFEINDRIEKTQNLISSLRDQDDYDGVDKARMRLNDLKNLSVIHKEIQSFKGGSSSQRGSFSNDRGLRDLEDRLQSGLQKLKINNVSKLSDRIEKTEALLDDLRDQSDYEEIERAEMKLDELRTLQNLHQEIRTRSRANSVQPVDTPERRLSDLEDALLQGLAKHKISDPRRLKDRIEKTQDLIEDMTEQDDYEGLKRAKTRLNELRKLSLISQEIQSIKSISNLSIDELEERLEAGLSKNKIQDLSKLSERIEKTQNLVYQMQDDDDEDGEERARQRLNELKNLQLIATQIASLKILQEPEDQEEIFLSGLVKHKIEDATKLREKIEKTESLIEYLKDQNDQEGLERALEKLQELRQLEKIGAEVEIDSETRLRRLEEKLEAGLIKHRLNDASKLSEKIEKTQILIDELRDQDETHGVQKAVIRMAELKKLQLIYNELLSIRTPVIPINPQLAKEKRVNELEERLMQGLVKHKINDISKLTEKIEKTKTLADELHEQDDQNGVEKALLRLNELRALLNIYQELSTIGVKEIKLRELEERNKKIELDAIREDISRMANSAERTCLMLLEIFKTRLLESTPLDQVSHIVNNLLNELHDHIRRQEIMNEEIKELLGDLKKYIQSDELSSCVSNISKILENLRPLNIYEMQRFVLKAQEAADLVRDKDVVLFVGITGSGKSTTIQFLAGAKMQYTKVEIEPGKYLEHITICGEVTNPCLANLTTSPLMRSETRYIMPIFVPLKDIYGSHETGFITLCDAPGFEDTAGAEVDIANSYGIVEAIKGCKSVKIVVLSSYVSLGDKGQGIQKLAHILINMISGIQDRLGSIFYAFTKYPPTTDINALLIEIKTSKVNEDRSLLSDSAFVTVLTDMINKTQNGALKVDPVKGDPREFMDKLKNLHGIAYPGEVFKFSISEKTQAIIHNQLNRDNLNIINACKRRDFELVAYFLRNLQILASVIKQSITNDIFQEAKRYVSECIHDLARDLEARFKIWLSSKDGLTEECLNCLSSILENIKNASILGDILDDSLVSYDAVMQNLCYEIETRSNILEDEELNSPLVSLHLNNLNILYDNFDGENYKDKIICQIKSILKNYGKKFEELILSVLPIIKSNDFKRTAETWLRVSDAYLILHSFLGYQIEELYAQPAKWLMSHLSAYLDKGEAILDKIRLQTEDIESLKSFIDICRSAKDTAALQDRYQSCVKSLQHTSFFDSQITTLDEIYNRLIAKMVNYFTDINLRVNDLFEKSGDHALEKIEKLIKDMDAIRSIPEVEAKTASAYYRCVENIRAYVQRIQGEAEKLLNFDTNSNSIDYKLLYRSLGRFKNTEWLNSISPGAYEDMINHISEELKEHASHLEERIKRLDIDLKHSNNVILANEILEKMDSMMIMEKYVPELKSYKESVFNIFVQNIKLSFDQIQKMFNLQENTVYQIKNELHELEALKREYESLNPAQIFLEKNDYLSITALNCEIEEWKVRTSAADEIANAELFRLNSEKEILDSYLATYEALCGGNCNGGIVDSVMQIFKKPSTIEADQYLEKLGYADIDDLRNSIEAKKQEILDTEELMKLKLPELSGRLEQLLAIKAEFDRLIKEKTELSEEEKNFLSLKEIDSPKALDEAIQNKKRIIIEREKNKQIYDFSEKLDASAVNNALIFIRCCENVLHIRAKEIASDTSNILAKYLNEYGKFLDQEIISKYKAASNYESEGGPLQHSFELDARLQEFFALEKYPLVFEAIDGYERKKFYEQEFLDCLRVLGSKMEENQHIGSRELRNQLYVAQALSCLDRFCGFSGNGFGTLYRQYRVEVSKESKKAYRTVLDHISKCDYANADISLSEIEDTPINAKDLAQIKHDLQCSLKKLMEDTKSSANWLDGRIEREHNNMKEIKDIRENVEKVRVALNKHAIKDHLDEGTRESLESFDNEINEILSRVFIRGLQSIEAYLDNKSYSEAEQGMENLSKVQRELSACCSSTAIYEKMNELRKTLDEIVDKIIKNYNFDDITKYPQDPPKDLLESLKKSAARGSARYIQAHSYALGRLRQSFNKAIDEVRTASMIGEVQSTIKARSEKIRSLKYALCFFPEDLHQEFKTQIEELKAFIEGEERANNDELNECLKLEDSDELTIKKLAELARKYDRENERELMKKLRNDVLNKSRLNEELFSKSLDGNNKLDLSVLKKILIYKQYLGQYFPEIEESNRNVKRLTRRKFKNCADTLVNIAIIEEPLIVENAYDNLMTCITFADLFKETDENILMDDDLETGCESFRKLAEYLLENTTKYVNAISQMNVDELYKCLNIAKKWDNLLKKIRNCHHKNFLTQSMLSIFTDCVLYEQMNDEINLSFINLGSQITVDLMNDDTKMYENKRELFFASLKELIIVLHEINLKLLASTKTHKIDEYLVEIKGKVEKIGNRLVDCARQQELSEKESNDFRMYYNHLESFNKHIKIKDLDVKSYLEKAESLIMEKVSKYRKEIASISSLDAEKNSKVCSSLIKMKFLSENISMLEYRINVEIDETLEAYKKKEGRLAITTLSMYLEKEEIGARLMADHSCLKGEDWRTRREKMQHQDNLDYVLKKLEGDSISKNILRSRFEAFKKKYDDLLKIYLEAFVSKRGEEPNLDPLISQIKLLVGTLNKNDGVAIWDRSLMDELPNLLAHIFAVWTLKNTQHYNASRDIDSAKAYLLMPHCAQVISVLRILGIGYEESVNIIGFNVPGIKKISDQLCNNLVEVGTGEGKSVIMAITACVFALIGYDVNCSCYSEYLSARDKNDFASLFNALGISDCIVYSTFNKLCEMFLNEQCDIRDKVRDLILSNKSSLDAFGSMKKIRQKVLLIDEVDVFLSNKYYGGTYTPSVFVKETTIKLLLDYLWTERSEKHTLQSIRNSDAYKSCATRFSNWMFLIDEAIKDMVFALQTYQSSTYIVHDDKILYVEGETMVDNVVRGYNTVWSYYHEHDKGKISPNSLESNAGIIINCGTFSFAEMPFDFAYIAGVTGTLKTLASAEKEILRNVYGIHKNTFMPSVFGETNRLYNSNSDVIAVSEGEYFMKIRGEIDLICNAKRAILVFFENEDKLMTFYNSSELQNIKSEVQVITEKISTTDRDLYIRRSTTEGRVTLLTKTFGRGTDFMCRNKQVLANGGVHVLQTFFSEELSEEYQIMGRGARQGDRGSYRMILLDKDLEWVLGPSWLEEVQRLQGSKLYPALKKARDDCYESKCGAKKISLAQNKAEHENSKLLLKALVDGSIETVKKLLDEQNRGANLGTGSSRTIVLMDATGSMWNLLSAAKETVTTMFQRTSEVLAEMKLPTDAFQMQFAVYRDYDCLETGLLQSSGWESKPQNLKSFMTTVTARGGDDYEEAVEIGLWHAVKESECEESISQVILIGDAPAKDITAILRDRRVMGESYWKKTKFDKPTHYADELEKLKTKSIPVHAFYLDKGAKENFLKIASETGGRCQELNIHSSEGAEMLTNLITEQVLHKSAGPQGQLAVELYRKKYARVSYKS